MAEGKYGLSSTLRFVERTLRAWTGRDVDLELELDARQVHAGEDLQARAIICSPDVDKTLDYLVVAMSGHVQREDRWRDYSDGSEVAQETQLGAGQELVVPMLIHIPEDAVLSEDGARWMLEARVVLGGALDVHASEPFEVLAPRAGALSDDAAGEEE